MHFLRAALVLAFTTAIAWAEEAERPWSFQPLKQSSLPETTNANWAQTRMDHFVLAKMESAGLQASAQADARTLIRRLYFDLVGLPPTPEAVEQFDLSQVETVVEELLASPHYGERWGRHWLDLARYTDKTATWLKSTGSAWLYRDWVVNAFNEDMPYDEFVKRQLATDLMDGTGAKDSSALGFLGLSPTYWKELLLPPELIKGTVADEWEERMDAVGRTFLGVTLACARCHDHKTDPITNMDYYGIAGVFASIRLQDLPTMEEELWAPVRKAKAEVANLEKERDALKKQKPKPENLDAQVAALEEKIQAIIKNTPHYNVPMANGVDEAALYVKPKGKEGEGTLLDYQANMSRDLPVHLRGNPNDEGEVVPRRFLSAFPASDGHPRKFERGSGRLDLAEAIIEDATPLTARVIVNRVWQHHFGKGLVGTPSEFGFAGEPPTHPELLDDLTARFIANGWSIKWLHREILLSATWQQSAIAPESEKKDPTNRYLARMPRRRLDVEVWRDSMLAVTGTLDPTSAGPSVLLTDANNHRRTIYGTVHRRELDQMLRLHDFPDPTAHSPARAKTTTPLQSLFTLNGPLIQRQAQALVDRLMKEEPSSAETRVRRAYHLLFQREPSSRERDLGIQFLTQQQESPAAWAQYAQVLLGSNEFFFVD